MSGLEFIGSAAAIIQLLEYVIKVRVCIKELAKRARNQSKILDELSNQVDCVIIAAQSVLSAFPLNPLVEQEARNCMDKARAMRELLANCRSEAPKEGRLGAWSSMMITMSWHAKDRAITSCWKDIKRSIWTLKFAASCKQLTTGMALPLGSDTSTTTPDCISSASLHVEVYKAADPPTMIVPANSTLPSRDLRFIGQEVLLTEVEQKLRSRHRIALVGIGGIGKSQLAIEVAHRAQRGSNELRILFASACSELHLEQSYSRFATDNKLATPEDSISLQCQAVRAFFESSSEISWLMIFDGADSAKVFYGPREFYKLLPQSSNGSILFTSRSADEALQMVLNEEDIVRLPRFSAGDAVKLFQTRLSSSKFHLAHVLQLVELLEGVPLALSQAASYVAKYCSSVDKYIKLFCTSEAERIALLGQGGSHEDGSVDKPVARTWQISFERIEQEHPLAVRLLCFAACLHHHQIPTAILPKTRIKVDMTTAVGVLEAHCMITEESPDNTFDMHSLIHLMTRHWLRSKGRLDEYSRLAFSVMQEAFPVELHSQEQMAYGYRYSAHAQALINNSQLDNFGESHAELASRLSRYFCVQGDFKSAIPCLRQAIALSGAIHGQDEPPTLARRSQFVVVKWFLEEYQEAEELAIQVLELQRKRLGHEHRDTLSTQSNLALIFHAQGKWSDAENLQRQTFKTRARTLGPSHGDTLKSLNNLGLSLKRQEKFEEAEEIFRQAFQEREKTLGKIDADTLGVMNNLALVLENCGRCEEALNFLYTVVEGKEILYGPRHLESLKSKQNIAVILTSQGRLGEAETLTRTVLGGYAELSFANHSDALYAQMCLVDILEGQSKYVEAICTCRQVYSARMAKLGEDHPETTFSWHRLKNLEEDSKSQLD